MPLRHTKLCLFISNKLWCHHVMQLSSTWSNWLTYIMSETVTFSQYNFDVKLPTGFFDKILRYYLCRVLKMFTAASENLTEIYPAYQRKCKQCTWLPPWLWHGHSFTGWLLACLSTALSTQAECLLFPLNVPSSLFCIYHQQFTSIYIKYCHISKYACILPRLELKKT